MVEGSHAKKEEVAAILHSLVFSATVRGDSRKAWFGGDGGWQRGGDDEEAAEVNYYCRAFFQKREVTDAVGPSGHVDAIAAAAFQRRRRRRLTE